jgi:hypothetical protein
MLSTMSQQRKFSDVPSRRRGRRRAGVVSAVVLIAAIGLAGCAGGTSPKTSPSSSFSYHPGTPSRLATPPSGTPTPVAPGSTKTAAPVPLASPAALPGNVTLQITNTAVGKVTGSGPGVIAGAAQVAFTLQFVNSSSRPFSIDTVQVNATYGSSSTPAVPVAAATKAFHGTLQSGASASAVYAFAIPASGRDDVAVTAWYAQGAPTVLFRGAVK